MTWVRAKLARGRWPRRLGWLALAAAGLIQLAWLAAALAGRWDYPFDLEWMEGGMLVHAARIARGDGIYVAPSVDFIPYLYTPLYPGVLAALEPLVGISYAVARAVSIAALAGTLALIPVAVARGACGDRRRWAWVGVALAGGLIAATYPWVDGWLDLARGDMLFLMLVFAGVTSLQAWARAGTGGRGHARVAAAATLLALAFFCKQTGVLYVAAGGVLLLVLNRRRLLTYIGVAGVIGLGGTWLLQRATDGWFWTYVFEVHQAHDCNADRFAKSFAVILWHFPAMTCVIVAALLVTLLTWATTRRRPASAEPLWVWSFLFAVSTLVGAVGFATQWAHNNAYIPAMCTGAVAAAAALPALAGCIDMWRSTPRWLANAIPLAAALALTATLITHRWQPSRFIPRDADRTAGARLIERIRAIDGDVWIPFHPWYAHLAGKPVHVHRMGVLDVSFVNHAPADLRCVWARGEVMANPPPWKIRGLAEAIAGHAFAAIVWDDRRIDALMPRLKRFYRLDDTLPATMRPRTYSGAIVRPSQIWIPIGPPAPPPGVHALWSFEGGKLDGWTITGTAWGHRPVARPLAHQGRVRRYGGRSWVDSMHGGDGATGVLRSPPFTITGSRITLRLSGGTDDALHADLYVDGERVATARPSIASERMDRHAWDVAHLRGKRAYIELVDDARNARGHLNVDEIWQWP